MNITQKILITILILNLSIQAQEALKTEKTETPPVETTPSNKDTKEPKKDGDKKGEKGTEPEEPSTIAYKQSSHQMKQLKSIRTTYINNGKEDGFNKLMQSYKDSQLLFKQKKYDEAIKGFSNVDQNLNNDSKTFMDGYKATYDKLLSLYSSKIVELNLEPKESAQYIANLEKKMNRAQEYSSIAQTYADSKNYVEAVYQYKNAINKLILIQEHMNQYQNRKLSPVEKIQKNIIIEEDYIPKDLLKDYDDSMNFVHADKEIERKKTKERVRKSLQKKYAKALKDKPIPTDDKDASVEGDMKLDVKVDKDTKSVEVKTEEVPKK